MVWSPPSRSTARRRCTVSGPRCCAPPVATASACSGVCRPSLLLGQDIQIVGGLFGKGPLVRAGYSDNRSRRRRVEVPGHPWRDGRTFQQASWLAPSLSARRRHRHWTGGEQTSARGDRRCGLSGRFCGCDGEACTSPPRRGMWERTPAECWTACALRRLPGVSARGRGTELWAADIVNSVIRKVTSDPKVAANWTWSLLRRRPVGAGSLRMRQVSNQLVVFKEDGTSSRSTATAPPNDLFPGLGGRRSRTMGCARASWLNNVWFRVGPSFYRLDMPYGHPPATGRVG